MKNNKKTAISALVTTVLGAALIAAPVTGFAADKKKAKKYERCGDVVKAGKNSCAVKALGLSCQGSAKSDNLAGAWIKVPTGTCKNIVAICDGKAEAPEGTKEKKLAKACKKIAKQTDESIVGGRLVNRYGEPIEQDDKS